MTGGAPARPAILLVSTADWDNPFWSNKQHVAVELARRGHRVLYVDSQGLRAPTATGRDLARVWRRLRRGLRRPRRVRENLWVASPLVVPLQRFGWARACNRRLLRRLVRRAARTLGETPRWIWTYSPLTTALYGLDGFERVVYHAVDDIKAQPGMPRAVIEAAEADLSRRADIVFTTSPRLQELHARHNPRTYLLPNVADYGHFSRALEGLEAPADLRAIAGPRIGFVGAISAYKLDLELLRRVAELRPHYSFVLIGRPGEGEPSGDLRDLHGAANIHLIGPRPYPRLPEYLAGFDVAMLPSRMSEYTASMFPMKFFEYLAAGRPVVSTSLPALAAYRRLALFADTPAEFAERLDAALAGAGTPLPERLAAARDQTYERRTGRMLALIDGEGDQATDASAGAVSSASAGLWSTEASAAITASADR